MRLVLWGAIVFAVVILLLRLKKITIQQASRDQEEQPIPQVSSETMVQCAQCGIYIPSSEALLVEPGLAFCSEEHRLKHFSS